MTFRRSSYCKTCHGLSGQGYHGYYAMPRLAGQQPKYIENQLRAFIEHRRKNDPQAFPLRCCDLVADTLRGDLSLELGKGQKDVECQPTHRSRGVELLGHRDE